MSLVNYVIILIIIIILNLKVTYASMYCLSLLLQVLIVDYIELAGVTMGAT